MYRLVLFCFILFVCFMGGGEGREEEEEGRRILVASQ